MSDPECCCPSAGWRRRLYGCRLLFDCSRLLPAKLCGPPWRVCIPSSPRRSSVWPPRCQYARPLPSFSASMPASSARRRCALTTGLLSRPWCVACLAVQTALCPNAVQVLVWGHAVNTLTAGAIGGVNTTRLPMPEYAPVALRVSLLFYSAS